MAEIRCPMCGKTNPEELETCQFCTARLKPLLPTSPPSGDEQGGTGESQPPPGHAQQDDSMADWLSFLRDSGAEGDSPADDARGEDQASPDSELPEWLDLPESGAGESAVKPAGEDNPPDWLDSLRKRSDEKTGPISEEIPAEEHLDEEWPASVPLPDHDYVPDWLAESGQGVQGSESNAEPPLSQDESGLEQGDEPDWLRNIRTKYKEDVGESAETEPIPADSSLPDWLEETTAETHGEPAAPSDNVSDWLSKLRSEDTLGGEEGEQAEVAAAGDAVLASGLEPQPPLEETPAPLLAAEEESAPPPEAGEVIPPPAGLSDEEIPDWLAGLVAGKATAAAMGSVDADAEGLPDWLADLDRSSAAEEGVIVPFGEEEPGLTFDWLQEQVRADQEPVSSEIEAEKIIPFVGDLSDFLEEEYLATPEGERAAEAVPEEGLEPAELPNWLEAMRPLGAAAMGAAILGEEEAQIESSGPLAGLRGVLPAEPDIARLKKPPTYAMRLQISESQQANASLLEELVKTEGEPRAVPGRAVITSQHVWRLIIFLVLLAVIFWKAFTGSQDVALPQLLPEVLDTSSVINGLPSNPVVLLAADYDPGFAGELKAASAAVIDHLMLKGSYFALVSTSPAGVGLAEQLIEAASAAGGHQYAVIEQYANLGYIPGGPAGVLGFATAPRKMTPYALDVDSTAIWGQEPLQSVTTLADFDLVAVLTEDADKARVWIEQVQPTLGSTPMVMLLSAQAEPMVRPYYQSGSNQVQGMVAGLPGGGAYESTHSDLLSGNGPARRYWDAFSLSMLAAVVLIGVGGLIDLTASGLLNRKKPEGEKKP